MSISDPASSSKEPDTRRRGAGSDTETAVSAERTSPGIRDGELLGGRFLIRREIGRGGTGTVFAALDVTVGQEVAVKVLNDRSFDPGRIERLRREVRASRPGHRNAVTVFDLYIDGGRYFLSMELVDGVSLRERLRRNEQMEIDDVIRLGRQVAAALADLHSKGLVHRDVKPGNVLIADDSTVKLCDMGLVRSTMRGGTVTETEMVVGTPAYMAPEQAVAADPTPASDVYALALTLCCSLTGEVPLLEDTAVATFLRRQRSRPPRMRKARHDCPRWLDRLLRQMLDPDPARRPSAAAVARALKLRRFGPWRMPRRREVVTAVVAAAVILGSAAVYRAVADPPAATVEVVGSEIVGYGEDGAELWREVLEEPLVELLRADLDGDGNDEVLAVGRNDHEKTVLAKDVRHARIQILDERGKTLTSIEPEAVIGSWSYPYRLEVIPTLHVVDLDDDGWLEVVAVCSQRNYFPTEVLVYWPRWNHWDRALSHPGSIYAVFPPRSDGPAGFRFLGVNNRLAMYAVLGEVALAPPGDRAAADAGRPIGFESPPYGLLIRAEGDGLYDYVPLVQQFYLDDLQMGNVKHHPDGSWSFPLSVQGFRIDRHLNIIEGPNAGRDLREMRKVFYRFLFESRPGLHSFSRAGIEAIRREMKSKCGSLLKEPAYETIYLDSVGRSLARTGDLGAAIELLRSAFQRLQNDELGYRLANLEAIAGDSAAAAATLRLIMDNPRSQRAAFDAPILLLRLAIEQHDEDLVDFAVWYVTSGARDPAELSIVRKTLLAGARMWWDTATEADAAVQSVDLAEAGGAIGCLIRWRRNAVRPEDPDEMRLLLDANPDIGGIGWAAFAAALLGNQNAVEATNVCDEAVAMLAERAKVDFGERQSLLLIRAIRAAALAEASDPSLARLEAESVLEEADRQLLPGIVAAEVLESTSG